MRQTTARESCRKRKVSGRELVVRTHLFLHVQGGCQRRDAIGAMRCDWSRWEQRLATRGRGHSTGLGTGTLQAPDTTPRATGETTGRRLPRHLTPDNPQNLLLESS
jgi:hypothetical protein